MSAEFMSDLRPLSTLSLPHSTLTALTRAGYETVQDLLTSTPEALAKDLSITLSSSQHIFSAAQTPRAVVPMTQSAASIVGATRTYSTQCDPLDRLLGGGLRRGHILELSGPPGSAKEVLAINMVRTFVKSVHEVLFVDMQNMTSPALLSRALHKPPSAPTESGKLVHHLALHTLLDLVIFLRNLESYLKEHPDVTSLLVLNSLSFPFQSTTSLPISRRGALLDIVKQTLTSVCTLRNLTVVITSQLATKMLNRDGTAANYNTGSRAVMAPPLGHSYLPSGRTSRVIVVPQTRTAGVLRLAPSSSSLAHVQGRQHIREERYETIGGTLQ